MKLKAIRRRPEAVGGIWWDYETKAQERVDGHFCLLIAEAGNPAFRNMHARMRIERMAELGGDAAQVVETMRDITARCLAETIVRGWCGLQHDDGSDDTYSPQRAYELLTDPALWKLLHFVQDTSGITHGYEEQEVAAAVGN